MQGLLKKWTLNYTLGEIIGIGLAGSIAYLAFQVIGEPTSLSQKAIILLCMLFAGFVEGAALAYLQWTVLVKKFKKIHRNIWMRNTILVAMLGWFLGMLPSLFLPHSSGSNFESLNADKLIFASLSVSMGLVLGAIFGIAQWLILRHHAMKAGQWILANALGWSLGILWIFLFASIPNTESSLIFILFLGIWGGIMTGISVGGITGWFLVKMQVKTHKT